MDCLCGRAGIMVSDRDFGSGVVELGILSGTVPGFPLFHYYDGLYTMSMLEC